MLSAASLRIIVTFLKAIKKSNIYKLLVEINRHIHLGGYVVDLRGTIQYKRIVVVEFSQFYTLGKNVGLRAQSNLMGSKPFS